MSELNFKLALAKIQAQVQKEREAREESYKNYPDINRYFAFVDLASSSNYRVANGSEKGYLRAEVFFSIIRSSIASCPEVSVLKEIGDEALLVSSEFRVLIESLIIINQVVKEMELVAGSQRYPLEVRMAIGGGIVKKLKRPNEDYIGKSVDQLARIMGIRSDLSNFLIHENLYSSSGISDIIKEYDFLEVSDQLPISEEQSKNALEKIYYREFYIDRNSISEYRKNFKYWV